MQVVRRVQLLDSKSVVPLPAVVAVAPMILMSLVLNLEVNFAILAFNLIGQLLMNA